MSNNYDDSYAVGSHECKRIENDLYSSAAGLQIFNILAFTVNWPENMFLRVIDNTFYVGGLINFHEGEDELVMDSVNLLESSLEKEIFEYIQSQCPFMQL